MIRLTCLLKRKPGMTPAQFHDYWRNHHGPLVMATRHGSHVLRYEQHPRPLEDYDGDDDSGYDGVTMQWFASMATYRAALGEDDTAEVMADIATFLDTSALAFVLTEEPHTVFDAL